MKQKVERDKLARELQDMVGYPSEREYKDMVSNKLLPNFPISTKDTTIAKSIFGPYLSGMKGKTIRHNPTRVYT